MSGDEDFLPSTVASFSSANKVTEKAVQPRAQEDLERIIVNDMNQLSIKDRELVYEDIF